MVSLVRCLNIIYTTDVCLKVGPTTFLLVSFSSLKESTCITLRKIFCISLQILFLFSRKSNLIILHIQISLPQQMPKNKIRSIIYQITWAKYIMLMKFGQFMPCYKKQLLKNSTKTATWKLFVFWKNWGQPLLENEIFEASCLY